MFVFVRFCPFLSVRFCPFSENRVPNGQKLLSISLIDVEKNHLNE